MRLHGRGFALAIYTISLLASAHVGSAQVFRDATPAEVAARQEARKFAREVPRFPGFGCKSFTAETLVTVEVSIAGGEAPCGAISFNEGRNEYQEINYYKVNNSTVPVSIFGSPKTSPGPAVIYLTGGPRGGKIAPNGLVEALVDAGYTVFSPVYQGQIMTNHPNPDISQAIQQVEGLRKILKSRLAAVVGVSAGGYLAAAACQQTCVEPQILVAPLLVSPEKRLFSGKNKEANPISGRNKKDDPIRECLRSSRDYSLVCDRPLILSRSFWGRYRFNSLSSIVRKRCGDHTSIIVSTSDKVVYSKRQVNLLKHSSAQIFLLAGLNHQDMIWSKLVSSRVLRLIQDRAERR